MTKAVVLGGGLAGILSAAAVVPHVDEVIIVEQDRLPDSPQPRRGLPQSQHNHMLMGGGARALESLLPGSIELLLASGAQRRSYMHGILLRSAEGWCRRFEDDAFVIACSRDLLDHVVRQQALCNGAISVVDSATAVGLTGDAAKVTGARVELRPGREAVFEADLVVDATGQRSKMPGWLAELGIPPVREEIVDPGFAYSCRWYEAPPGAHEDFPGVLIQPQHATGRPGVGAALMPNENGRWIAVMIGTRGGRPPTEENRFMEFARGERTRLVADLIAGARPVSPIRAYRDLANRRRYYERAALPERLVIIGDAATRLNPTYATGMSVAAQSTVALRDELARVGLTPKLSGKAQARIAKIGNGPWQMALGLDHWFPGVESNAKRRGGKRMMRFGARYARTATDRFPVGNAVFLVAALMARPRYLMRPSLLFAVLRGPRRPPLTAEQAIAQFPEFGHLARPVSAASADGEK